MDTAKVALRYDRLLAGCVAQGAEDLVHTLRNWLKAVILPLVSFLVIVTAFGGIRAPGKYNGVVIFDRWGACHLYGGIYLMEISERIKESLRAFQGEAVLIDALEVHQPMNPGDGLITKLRVLGPAEEKVGGPFGGTPNLQGLSLRVMPNFSAQDADELIIELRNDSNSRIKINTGALGPTLLSKKQGLECMSPADGPSYAAVTRTDVAFLHQGPAGGTCLVNGKGRTVKLSLLPGAAFSERFDLDPGQSIEVPLRFKLSPGEYEFLAGYGGGTHETRALVSNQFGFDVDETGKAHLAKGALVSNQVRPSRSVGAVCGRVALEDGNPVGKARVILWPFPVAKEQPRAANMAFTNGDGWFRMESVLEGKYALSAMSADSGAVLAGAYGGRRPVDAPALSLPVSSEVCSLVVIVHPQPGYFVRGHTEPGEPSSGARTARMIMTRGHTFPFESTAIVQPNGQYEFRNVPAGLYHFFAGWTGSGFEVTDDIDDLDIDIKWPDEELEQIVTRDGRAMGRLESDEFLTVSALEQIRRAQRQYANTYKTGFAKSLNVLGPAPDWFRATADRAGLVDEVKAGLLPGQDGSHFSENGYSVSYLPGPPDDNGEIATYTLSARPVEFGKTGTRSFVLDEGGIVHATEANRPAMREDPVVTN
jgi:hypothetical protein